MLNDAFIDSLNNQVATRNFGGTVKGTAEPYVTGYHHIWWDRLPTLMQGSGIKAEEVLSASCLSVTPPGGTLNKISFTGLGGTKWAVPGGIDYGDSISIKFLEFRGLPITQFFHEWVKGIRDYRTGVSSELIGDDYIKENYSANLAYWTTAPDGITIEYCAYYTGVFPLKDPQDLLSSDVENIGKIEPEIEFNVDYIWHEDWVKTKIQDTMSSKHTNALDRALTKFK